MNHSILSTSTFNEPCGIFINPLTIALATDSPVDISLNSLLYTERDNQADDGGSGHQR